MRLELTRRADYGIRAGLALARLEGEARVSARRIAESERIPPAFVAQVMTDLVQAGIADGIVGRVGGYRLSRPADEISILDVIEAVEGDTRRRTCVLRGGACRASGTCDVHEVFASAQEEMLGRLARSSLADIVTAGLTSAAARP